MNLEERAQRDDLLYVPVGRTVVEEAINRGTTGPVILSFIRRRDHPLLVDMTVHRPAANLAEQARQAKDARRRRIQKATV